MVTKEYLLHTPDLALPAQWPVNCYLAKSVSSYVTAFLQLNYKIK